ncbi:MAG: RluA family pseudouridine synthase [Polyangiaceae bacterium]|nr:RluA family pseudouridine synthase [Polyangiaceae bacterium]
MTSGRSSAPNAGAAPLSFVVTEREGGARLDAVVQRRLVTLGRRAVAERFAAGAVRCDGRVSRKGDVAVPGATVEVAPIAARLEPEPHAVLDVRFVAEAYVVVAKPAGQPTVPLRAGETGTLANAIAARFPEVVGLGRRPEDAGLVHRLDTETSGLLVVARTQPAHDRLVAALGAGELDKRYLAVVSGAPPDDAGEIALALVPRARSGRRVTVAAGTTAGHAARTRYRVLVRGARSLIEAQASPAYRHQVRVHLATLGCPIVGDALYGGAFEPSLGSRHALHASRIAWAGAPGLEGFAVDLALPEELARVVGR